MPLHDWFWIIYVIAIILGFYFSYEPGRRVWFASPAISAVLFFILGYAEFGSPLKH